MAWRRFSRIPEPRAEGGSTADADPVTEPSGEAEDLPSWIKSLHPSAPDSAQLEATVRQQLARLTPADLPGLDYDMRWRSGWRTDEWDEMEPTDAADLLQRAGDRTVVAAGLSMHPNGYIREQAVRALAAAEDDRAFPWLVLRCGDWVGEVRGPALSAVEAWIDPSRAELLLLTLPILSGGRFGPDRAAHGLRRRFEHALRAESARPAVWAAAGSTDRSIRRAAVRLLVDQGATVELLRAVASTRDIVAISIVAAGLPTSGPINEEAGAVLWRSPMPRLRAEGLWRLLAGSDEVEDRELIELGLLDSAPSVREVAQRFIAQRQEDVAGFYRSCLGSHPAAALNGLGDRADPQDVEVALAHLGAESSRVRVAALRLLARIGRPDDGGLFTSRFMDGRGKERREALVGLRHSGVMRTALDAVWLDAVERGDPEVKKRVLFQLLPLAERWRRLDVGLQAVVDEDRSISQAGLEVLRRTLVDWNRGYPAPSTVDPRTLRRHFEQARPALVEGRRRGFEHFVAMVESLIPAE
jgi:HEAT repeat protein